MRLPDRFGWDRRSGMTWPEFTDWSRKSGDAAQRVVQGGLLLGVWVDLPGWWSLALVAVVAVVTFLVCVTAPIDR